MTEFYERIKEIEEMYDIKGEDDVHTDTILELKDALDWSGKYHFWLKEGFETGDATQEEIEEDLKQFKCKNEDELFELLDDEFCKYYEGNCKSQ